MGAWPATKARRVLAALKRIGWRVKREASGSHVVLEHKSLPDYTWAFHDDVEIGPKMMARISAKTGLRREDL